MLNPWFAVPDDLLTRSIAAWVGMIALLGLEAEAGVFMLLYLEVEDLF